MPSIIISGTNTICVNNTTTLTAGGGVTYLWNTSSTNNSITVSPVTTTTYSVKGTDGIGCSDTKTITVTVNSLPTLTLTPTATICTGSSISLSVGGASTYTWNTGANTTSISASPTTSVYYSVTGSDSNGCMKKDSVMINVDPCTGIKELNITNQTLNVYPNPAKDKATVSFLANRESLFVLNLIDSKGINVKQEMIRTRSGENSHSIDLTEMQSGLYFILIQNNEGTFRGKIIVE